MNHILILENPGTDQQPACDHVFSFCDNPANSFPEDYLGPADADSVYQKVYDVVCARLSDEKFRECFSYRDVQILWCFKKELFHKIYWAALKWEVMRRVIKKHPVSQFSIARDTGTSGLADILEEVDTAVLPAIEWRGQILPEERSSMGGAPRKRSILKWPDILSLSDPGKVQRVIFSDPARSRAVIRNLPVSTCVIFSNVPAPRTLAWSLMNRVSYFQMSFSCGRHEGHTPVIERFCRLLKKEKIFAGIVWDGFNAEQLLEREMLAIFEGWLPRLLFEIDGMDRFFGGLPNLRSALLDEDMDPCKNAFCQLAKKYGVETFVELHGAIGAKHGLIPLTADKMFVWGKSQKDKLIRWGCPDDKIVVSGCSRYAHYQTMDEMQSRKKVANDLGLQVSRKTVLLVFAPVNRWNSWYEHRVWRVISEALAAAEELSKQLQVQFVIKLHPAETNESFYHAWVKKCGLQDRVKVLRKYDPLLLAKAVDLLWVYGSTYAIDGLALNKPVICLDDEWDPLLEEFRPYAVFFYANDKGEILRAASDVLQNGFLRPASWARAKSECLNEGEKDPAAFIASHMSHV